MRSISPLVSIGIPTFNRANDLRRAITSALSQTYVNLEIIVSDNGSTDDTNGVCLTLIREHKNIRYQRLEENVGAIPNFLNVLAASSAEYFMWLADDDWIEPNYVEDCYKYLRDNPEFVLACGKDRYFANETLRYLGREISLLDSSPEERILSYFRKVTHNGMFYGLMRRDLLSKLSFPTMLAADWVLMAQVAALGKTKTLTTTFINRSIGGESQDLSELAIRLGYTRSQSKDPWRLIARLMFLEIAWRNRQLRAMELPRRLRLANRVSASIRQRMRQSRKQSFLRNSWQDLVNNIRKFIDRHITWRIRDFL